MTQDPRGGARHRESDPGRLTRLSPWTFRYARLLQLRWYMSAGPLVGMVSVASSLTVRGVTSPAVQPAVVDLQIGGVLVAPVAFAAASIVLIAALLLKRGLEGAHLLAAAVSVTYALASGYSVAVGGGWAVAGLSLGTAITCMFLAATFWKGR